MQRISHHVALAGMVMVLSLAIGCAQNVADPASGEAGANDPADATATTAVDDHSGWWCVEHGVPEEICGVCDPKLAAKFQNKGDWCKEHDRPDSQCFVCHPELEARFAAQYEAKYGKKPPKPEG
ncbi:MAG: RND transporter [Pirellulales bacterium]